MKPLRKCKCGLEAYTREDLELFSKHPGCKYGRRTVCKECHNRDSQAYHIKNPHVKRSHQAMKHYGITEEVYEGCMSTSDVCEVCGDTENLCYDHCHTVGKGIEAFRGVLCRTCNAGLGQIGDTLEAVNKVVTYLKRRRK